jgi:hypothetical protein
LIAIGGPGPLTHCSVTSEQYSEETAYLFSLGTG